ncbi:MAG: oligosaccharide flippase family protein [Crinalium sp.]
MQERKPLTMRRNFSWTLVGNVVYAASQWGVLVVLAKLGSPEMVGQFTLGLAVTAPVMILFNLALRQVQATDANGEYQFSDYLSLRLITTTFALLVIAVIVSLAGYSWQTSLVILVVGLAKAFESISDVFYGLLQQHEQMDRIAISMMIKGSVSLLMLSIGVYLTGSVLGGAVGLVIAWAFVLVSYDIYSGALILNIPLLPMLLGKMGRNIRFSIKQPYRKLKTLRKLVEMALPLGFAAMLVSLNANIPRYFIERYLGVRELGIFAAMSYLMVAGGIVVGALGQSAVPRFAKYYLEKNLAAFYTLLFKLSGIGVLFGGVGVLGALVAGRQILTLLYTPEYAEYANVFLWLMVAAGLGYIGSFLGCGIIGTRAYRYFTIPYLVMTLITVAASLLLIPDFGLVGAAWTSCIISLASCVMPIIILITLRRYL